MSGKSIFIHGSQRTLHSLKMALQSLRSIVKAGVLFFILIFALQAMMRTDVRSWQNLGYYTLAQTADFMGMKKTKISFIPPSGYKMLISVKRFPHSGIVALWKNRFSSELLEAAKFAGLSSLGLMLLLTGFFVYRGYRLVQDKTEGEREFSAKQLAKLIKAYNDKEKHRAKYSIANVPFPQDAEFAHLMICGSTGTGKTVLISDLLKQIKANGDKAFIFDKMGSFTEHFFEEGKDHLLNPFDSRSEVWQMFDEVSCAEHFDAIAKTLIPENDSPDPFWELAARTLFSEICAQAYRQGQKLSNKELTNIILKRSMAEAAQMVKDTAAQSLIDPESPKTALSIRAVLSTHLKGFCALRDGKATFSIGNWIRDDNDSSCVFVTSRGDLHATLQPLISVWFEILLFNLLSLPRNTGRRVWIILDELPALNRLYSLTDGLAQARQFGGCFVIGIQSFAQLITTYGQGRADAINAVTRNKVFLATPDEGTAKWAASNLGKMEIEEFKEGMHYGGHPRFGGTMNISTHKSQKERISPFKIMNLKKLTGYLLMKEGFAPAFIEFKPHKLPQIAEGFMASSSLVQEVVAQSLGVVPLEESLKRQANAVEEESAPADNNTSPAPVEALEEMNEEEDNEWLEDEGEETSEDDEDVIAEDSDKNSRAEPVLATAGDAQNVKNNDQLNFEI
jgi:type IV conjugative transfer system coupling protein TraD